MNRLVSSLLLCLALASRMAFAAEPPAPAEPAQAAEPVERDEAKPDEDRDAKVSI
jgi:hypothetical protein